MESISLHFQSLLQHWNVVVCNNMKYSIIEGSINPKKWTLVTLATCPNPKKSSDGRHTNIYCWAKIFLFGSHEMKTNLVTLSVWLWLSRDILRSCKKIWRRTPPMSLKSSGLLSCQTSILGSMIHHWQLRKWKSTFAISTTISLLSVSSTVCKIWLLR